MSCEHCKNACAIRIGRCVLKLKYENGMRVDLTERAFDAKHCPHCGDSLDDPQPLSTDELRTRSGKPVWVQSDIWNGWVLVTRGETVGGWDPFGNFLSIQEMTGDGSVCYDRPMEV